MGGDQSKLKTTSAPALGEDVDVTPSWASKLPASSPRVFFDIAVNDQHYGRVEMTLAEVSMLQNCLDCTCS